MKAAVAFWLCLSATIASSWAYADECDERKPTRKECVCGCNYWNATSRAIGACSLTERANSWCAISHIGHTGSLGEFSIEGTAEGATLDMSEIRRGAAERFYLEIPYPDQLPDYRTKEYADLLEQYTFGIFNTLQIENFLRYMAYPEAKEELPTELAFTMFLWARGGYISVPYNRDGPGVELVGVLDKELAKRLLTDANISQTFFAGLEGEVYQPDEQTIVTRGYFRFAYDTQTTVRMIYRELLPAE